MTLIAAFTGSFGTVCLCDSQETVGGYAKKSVAKLEYTEGPVSFAIAGAGDGTHIKALTFELTGALSKLQDYSQGRVLEALKTVSLDYFRSYIWPRGADRPSLEILVITNPPGTIPDLWHISDGTAQWLERGEVSIGIGSYLADYLASHLDSFRQDEAEAIAVAAYILKEVKDHIDGVGMDGTIYLFRKDGSVEYLFQEDLTMLDPVFCKFNELISHVFNSTFCLKIPLTAEEIERERQELRDQYISIVMKIREQQTKTGFRSLPFCDTGTD